MEIVLTKNNLTDLNVFFYKKGFTNIHRPFISLLKIDSAMKTNPIFHIGFKENMGFTSGNKIYTGVMVFEVLNGYPLQSIMFTNNSNSSVKQYQQSLEDLEVMDFYCIQKKNQDPYGDFVLKNVKFIDTRMTQSTQEFSRKIVATFVCSDKVPFRFPYFFNEFKSDNYSSHLVRKKEEINAICKDIESLSGVLNKKQLVEYYKILTNNIIVNSNISTENIKQELKQLFEEVINDFIFRRTMKRYSAIYRIRDFIAVFYKFRNEYVYSHPDEFGGRGDLDFLKFMDIDVNNWIENFKKENSNG